MNENIPGNEAGVGAERGEQAERLSRQPYVAPRIERLDVEDTRFFIGPGFDGTTTFSS
ncbi:MULTISPECIES: hypothetical protein [unclassified Pseudomonas]|uniref:hypothetical protein n=1 Tax=unclassified Pseudomonas TaxID=196821 RepID=UPI00244A0D3B|nr:MULTISPECIES: hypothetical protein [unclassified Pseudomonas]MDH0895940.1 hypothetical protein [Pseudomonas sp. GD03875]MDH1067153.1 hypothetical protein [Pseudomonas sp. GD03985]